MAFIPKLGELKPDRNVPEWRVSMPVPVAFFAGTALTFFIEDEAEVDAPGLRVAVERVLSLGEEDRLAVSASVYENYREFLEASDLEPLDIATPTDIWRYVQPTAVHITRRSRRDRDVYVTFMCECAWEAEHGMQLVFRGGDRLVRVSYQDGHVTHADAHNIPDDQDAGLRATNSSSGGSAV
jgi:hypothetical protein